MSGLQRREAEQGGSQLGPQSWRPQGGRRIRERALQGDDIILAATLGTNTGFCGTVEAACVVGVLDLLLTARDAGVIRFRVRGYNS